jgi:hypothetical protein
MLDGRGINRFAVGYGMVVSTTTGPRSSHPRRGRTWALIVFALLVLVMAGLVAAVVIGLLRLGGVTAWPSHTLALVLLIVGCAPPTLLLVLSAFEDGPISGSFGDFVTGLLWWW